MGDERCDVNAASAIVLAAWPRRGAHAECVNVARPIVSRSVARCLRIRGSCAAARPYQSGGRDTRLACPILSPEDSLEAVARLRLRLVRRGRERVPSQGSLNVVPLVVSYSARLARPGASTTISRAAAGTSRELVRPPGQRTRSLAGPGGRARTCTALSCDQ